MRYLALGALACLLMTTPAYAQATDPAVVAPITTFIDAFNKGDVAGAAATHAAVADLVDRRRSGALRVARAKGVPGLGRRPRRPPTPRPASPTRRS